MKKVWLVKSRWSSIYVESPDIASAINRYKRIIAKDMREFVGTEHQPKLDATITSAEFMGELI